MIPIPQALSNLTLQAWIPRSYPKRPRGLINGIVVGMIRMIWSLPRNVNKSMLKFEDGKYG